MPGPSGGNAEPSTRFWACPTHINGLDPESVSRLFEEDLFVLLQPTATTSGPQEPAFQTHRKLGPLRYGDLNAVVEKRIVNLTKFLRRVALAEKTLEGPEGFYRPRRFRSLAGDSHNGGQRPLVIYHEPDPRVMKFADPRPYQLLRSVFKELSTGIGVDLTPPPIVADPGHQWYVIPYLIPDDESHGDVEGFMFSIGALTAAAYCLQIVDLHLENILVTKGNPIVVDPECILYSFGPRSEKQRLLNTGLLSHSPGLSALRGGDISEQKIFQIDLYERDDGVLDYRKPATPFHNRVYGQDGQIADPADFRQHVVAGYKAAFDWFTKHNAVVADIIDTIVTDDFRIRYLVRKTRHYLSVIHMLNLPMGGRYADWRENVFQRFRFSGHFPKEVSETTFAAELEDLESRDIPYFWVNAGERELRHRTGSTQSIDLEQTAREQAIHDIRNLKSENLDSQIKVLNDFLDIDINRPIDPAE